MNVEPAYLATLCARATSRKCPNLHSVGRTQYHFTEHGRTVVMSMAGSNSVGDWLTRNIWAWPARFGQGWAHQAWLHEAKLLYEELRLPLLGYKRIEIGAYSFGAAVGILLSRRLTMDGFQVKVTTFGCPAVGSECVSNGRWCEMEHYRNEWDYVTILPPWMCGVPSTVLQGRKGHSIKAYIENLS